MKINDYKRSIKAKLSKRFFMNLGIFASFLLVTVLSLYAWSPAKESSAFDWTTVDGASPYVASLSGDDEIRISATPSASQAVFDQDDTLELTSTCPYGAAIYLNMDSSESNALSREGTDEGIKTISATTGTVLNDNSWGYSLDNGSTFLPMPLSTGTPVNIYNSEQVESNTEITVKYGMKIDSSIPSGYYSGNVLYSIVTNPSCAKYTLTFDTDGGTPIEDVLLTYGQTIDLPDYTTTKDNYDFDGWELTGSMSTTYDGTETDVDVNPGNSLTVELKAKWVSAQTTFSSIRTLQEMTPSICYAETTPLASATGTTYRHSNSTSLVPTAVLTDTRDSNEYVVKKLADGRCWITENLRIANKTINSDDSNLPSGVTYNIPASDLSSFTDAQDTNSVYIDSTYGGYYNFYTATAGWGASSVASGNAPQDICPKGWRLPTGGNSSELQTIYNKYPSNAAITGKPGFSYSGIASPNFGSVISQDEDGYYLSSTPRSNDKVFGLMIGGGLNATYSDGRDGGYSIHCIARNDSMQNFDEISLSAGESRVLLDERDGNVYTVKKLADGNIWMTENLRLGGSEPMTLTSADSDVSSDYQLPAKIETLSSEDFAETNISHVYKNSADSGFYNFYTATAGTGGTNLRSGNAPASICPKGWRLPTGGSSGEFNSLYTKYNSSALLQGDPGFIFSGYIYSGTIDSSNSSGRYWSSTADGPDYGFYFGFYSSSVYPTYNYAKYAGFSIRCIARKIPAMQVFNKTTLTNIGDSIDLRDERDGNVYTVKKLADGNVWMTENLQIINKTITSADSNLPSGVTYTVPASDRSSFSTTINANAAYIDSTYGGYYNFYTATAGWGASSVASGNSPRDICPKGWRIPTGSSSGELQAINNIYNSGATMQSEMNLPLSGYVKYAIMRDQRTNGLFWSSTVRDASNAYLMLVESSNNISTAGWNEKIRGFAIRCLAQ